MAKLLTGQYLIIDSQQVHNNWGLVIEDNKIKEIGPNKELLNKYPGLEHLDYEDKIIAPGFINTHMHSYGVLSHGIPNIDVDSFESFLKDFWWPLVEDRIDQKMIKVTTKSAAAELISSGVTSFCNVMEAPTAIPNALKTQAQVLEEIGIKAVLSFEATQRKSDANGNLGLQENEDFFLEYKGHPLINGMMCIHTTFTCSQDFIKKASQKAKDIGSGIQMHLSESSYEVDYTLDKYGLTPIELYDKLDYLDDYILASQGVKLNSNEIDILKTKDNVNIAHVPLSNCEVGGGIAPVKELLDNDINVGLGTDGYINNFFEAMRAAFLIHKAKHENPEVMPAQEVYKMATENGAKALHLNQSGTIKKENYADIITINTDTLTPINKSNIFEQLILYRNPENVTDVFINGKQLKKDGELTNLNLDQIKMDVNEQAKRLWKEIKK